jgi:hypothetical protein
LLAGFASASARPSMRQHTQVQMGCIGASPAARSSSGICQSAPAAPH